MLYIDLMTWASSLKTLFLNLKTSIMDLDTLYFHL